MIKKEIYIPIGQQSSRDLFSKIIEITRKCTSRMLIEKGDKTINAKSMLGLFALAQSGTKHKTYIIIDGEDENEALEKIKDYILGD